MALAVFEPLSLPQESVWAVLVVCGFEGGWSATPSSPLALPAAPYRPSSVERRRRPKTSQINFSGKLDQFWFLLCLIIFFLFKGRIETLVLKMLKLSKSD